MQENIADLVDNNVFPEQARFVLASKLQRALNYFIDLTLYYYGMYKLFSIPASSVRPVNALSVILNHTSQQFLYAAICLPFIYFLMEGITRGRSLGKFLTHTVAIRKDLSPITWKQAFTRSLVRIFPLDPLSGLFGPPLHDRWTGTMVVRKDSLVY